MINLTLLKFSFFILLPRFVATVEQELGASRDVLTILENYKRHAGPDFARELDVLTADMRNSAASTRLRVVERGLVFIKKLPPFAR